LIALLISVTQFRYEHNVVFIWYDMPLSLPTGINYNVLNIMWGGEKGEVRVVIVW